MSLRFGVLGAGRIGKIHSARLAAMRDVELIAVADPMLDDAWAASLKIPQRLKCEEEFFSLDLDAVIIASPTTKHFTHVMQALDRGWHVLCEKPLDPSLAAHDALIEKLATSTGKLQIGFNRRFDLDFEKIAVLNREEKLGRPYLMRITSRDPGLPSREYLQSSGGMFMDMSIHDFDMARFVMQSEVTEIFAYGAALVDKNLRDIDDIDTAVITLKFANGAFAVIDNSRQAVYGYDQRLELFGSAGSADNLNHRPHSVVRNDAFGAHLVPMENFFLERYALSYRRELEAFVKAINDDQPCTPSIHDAKAAIKLAILAKESLLSRRAISVESCS